VIRGIVIIWKDKAIANCSGATLGCSNRLYSDLILKEYKENIFHKLKYINIKLIQLYIYKSIYILFLEK